MLEIPEQKEKDIIDKREFRKRRKNVYAKHNPDFQKVLDVDFEKKISWGTVIEESAQKYSKNVAIKFEDMMLTYKEFNEYVNQYAHYFISLGLNKGDVVEILMTNRPEFIIIFTAISKIGAISSLINTELRDKSLLYCLKLTLGKFIIVGSELINAFRNIESELNLSKKQNLLFSPDRDSIPIPDGFIDINQKIKNFPSHNPSTTINVKTNDLIAYLFTSGTTGKSKAAKVLHRSLILNGIMFGHIVLEATPNDTIYVALPFFHGTAIWLGWSPALASGAALAIGRKFSVSRFWDEIRKYNATMFTYVGEVCRYLMNQDPTPKEKDNTVRAIIGNGLRPEIWKEFKERFNISIVAEAYGASEGVGGFFNLLNFDCTIGLCTVKYAIVKFDSELEKPIISEDGLMQRVGLGETGLCLFECVGETEFSGYTDRKATEAKLFHNVFKEGDLWFNTGDLLKDLGCTHAQFVDRLGDTFRWKGHNVSTTEVEEVLNIFDQVYISSVYGIQIPNTDGRAGMAAILPKEGIEDFNLKKIADILRKNLPVYAIPIFLRINSEISITPTFKLKKARLKKESFNFESTEDPLYVMLPGESEYTPLTKGIYENIQSGLYKF
ncbi:MAG: long-chain-acyl-CoA synthetase [Promethearchaeota archaeon]|jgi:citronellyl-CoA synthetase